MCKEKAELLISVPRARLMVLSRFSAANRPFLGHRSTKATRQGSRDSHAPTGVRREPERRLPTDVRLAGAAPAVGRRESLVDHPVELFDVFSRKLAIGLPHRTHEAKAEFLGICVAQDRLVVTRVTAVLHCEADAVAGDGCEVPLSHEVEESFDLRAVVLKPAVCHRRRA
jgi:hypothetical protein